MNTLLRNLIALALLFAADDKLDSLGTLITDLAILVEDECEPPIFVP